MIALRQTVTLAMAFAMLSMTSTSLASTALSSTSAIAQEDEGPLVAPPSAADLAAAKSPDQAQLIDAVASAPPAQVPAMPMRSTIEKYLQIGAPVVTSFNLEAYQAAQQELPEFWPKSTPHEQDVCSPHKALADSNAGQHDLAPFFSAGEFTTSRRTKPDDDVSAEEPWLVPQSHRPSMPHYIPTPHNPAVSVLRYGPHLEHAERTSEELANEVERFLHITPTPPEGPFEAIQANVAIDPNGAVQQLPFEAPAQAPVSPQEEFDLEDGEAAAELLPIFMRQQSALEGTVFGSDEQGEEQQLGARRNFIERIRELEAAHGQEQLGETQGASYETPFGQQPDRPFVPGVNPAAYAEQQIVTPEQCFDTDGDDFLSEQMLNSLFGGYTYHSAATPPYEDNVGSDSYREAHANQEESATDEYAVEVLRNSAEQMEHSANLMERRNLFEEADKLRGMANELRLAARVRVQGESGAKVSPVYGWPSAVPQDYTLSVPNSSSLQPYRPMTDDNYYKNSGYDGEWQSSPAQLTPPYIPDAGSNQTTSFQPVPMHTVSTSEFMQADQEWHVPAPNSDSDQPPMVYQQQYFRPLSESWDRGFVPSPAPAEYNPFGLQLLDSEKTGWGWWLPHLDRDGNRIFGDRWRFLSIEHNAG